MPLSDAKKLSNKKWNDVNLKIKYDQISVNVKKGEREKIRAYAESTGESMNGFITRAIFETLERETKGKPKLKPKLDPIEEDAYE